MEALRPYFAGHVTGLESPAPPYAGPHGHHRLCPRLRGQLCDSQLGLGQPFVQRGASLLHRRTNAGAYAGSPGPPTLYLDLLASGAFLVALQNAIDLRSHVFDGLRRPSEWATTRLTVSRLAASITGPILRSHMHSLLTW